MFRLALLILVLLALSAQHSSARTFVVGPEEQYQQISAALQAASAGDEILVRSGIYREDLLLDKTVSVIGEDRAEIVGSGAGSVITIAADGCTVRHFLVTHSGSDLRAEDAGVLLRSNSNVVLDNTLTDVLFGIYLYNSANNLIRGNTVTGRGELEVGERGAGLHLWNSANNRLENNTITTTRDGMYVQSSPGNTMTGNDVSNLRYGLHFMNSDHNRFEGNNFHDNVAGAAIMYSEHIQLRRNAFVHNRGFSSFGILFQDCRECIIEDNLIDNNATGVFLEGVRNSIFRSNSISENDVAAQIFSSSENNVFTGNNFVANLSPLQMIGKSTSTSWADGERGNYWSDYSGYDLDGDSTGDVPFRVQNVFQYLEGNFPRLRLYLNSPAARSIAVAEQAFPIIQGSNQFDPKPLMHPVELAPIGAKSSNNSPFVPMLLVSMLALAASSAVFWRSRT